MREYFARCLLSLWSLLLVGIVACGDATNPTSPSGSGGPPGAGAGDFNRTPGEGTPPGGGVAELSARAPHRVGLLYQAALLCP